MRISVIVTTYNQPEYLSLVLAGLYRQERTADEIFIADDGSGPETVDVINTFIDKKQNSPVHIYHNDKGFRAAAIRNKAILKSTGDYIILLDGDCIPDIHFVKDHAKLAQKESFFQGKRILVDEILSKTFTGKESGSFWGRIAHFFKKGISNRHHLIRLPFFPAFFSKKLGGIRSCNMGFFRNDIFAVNGFNEDFQGWGREDSELAARFFAYGLKKKTHPFMAACFHLWHPNHDRNRLAINDQLLKQAIGSHEYHCSNGLVKKN